MQKLENEWRKSMDELIRWQEKYREAYDNYSNILKNGKDNELAYEGKRKIKTPDGTDATKQGSVSR